MNKGKVKQLRYKSEAHSSVTYLRGSLDKLDHNLQILTGYCTNGAEYVTPQSLSTMNLFNIDALQISNIFPSLFQGEEIT